MKNYIQFCEFTVSVADTLFTRTLIGYQSSYVTKMSYEVIAVKDWPKNVQIMDSEFGKPQNWDTFPWLSNFRFSENILNKFNSKSSWFKEKSYFLKGFITQKTDNGAFLPPLL